MLHATMKTALPLLLASQAGLITAAPSSLLSRQFSGREFWCSGSEDIRDFAVAEEIVERTSAYTLIDTFVQDTPDNWLSRIDQHIYSDSGRDRVGISECSDLEKDRCNPLNGAKCKELFDRNTFGKLGYWVFKSVYGAHGTIIAMYNKLDGEVLSESLALPSMVEDFDVSSDQDMFGSIASLFLGGLSMSSAVAGGGAGTAMSIMGTLLGAVGSGGGPGEDEVIKLSEVQKKLGEMFNSRRKFLSNTMDLLMGNGDDFDNLPNLGEGQKMSDGHPIAKFFSHPFWLLDSDAELVRSMIDDVGRHIREMMIDFILQTGDWKIVGNNLIDTQEECDSLGGYRWVKAGDEHWCFSLYNRGDVNDSEVPEIMKKHGIDSLQEYFEIAIECAKSGDSGAKELDPKNLVPNDSGKPHCFYSIPVKKRVGATGGDGGGGIGGNNLKGYTLEDFF